MYLPVIRRLLIGMALGTAAALACAGPAHADEYDFISELDANGIYYSNINATIDIGKIACHDMRAHTEGRVAITRISNDGGWTIDEAKIVARAALRNMCPNALAWFQPQS